MNSQARISVTNPQAIVFLVDQSGSMSEKFVWDGTLMSKAEAVAQVINYALEEIVARCNSFGTLKDYFHISVLGYGGDGVNSLLGYEGLETVSVIDSSVVERKEVVNVRLVNGQKVLTRLNRKIWVKPNSEGVSPMCAAYDKAYSVLAPWIHSRLDTYTAAPLVINITDGEATDSPLARITRSANRIKSLSTLGGSTILMNIHISGQSSQSQLFPNASDGVDPRYFVARHLFTLSSEMPESYNHEISLISSAQPPYRAFACNTQITDLLKLLDISSTTLKFTV